MLNKAESKRKTVHGSTDRAHKSAMGQFMTNANVASFMASLFRDELQHPLKLLDPGAGLGALTCALLDRFGRSAEGAVVEAWELDPKLFAHLRETLAGYEERGVRLELHNGDFLAQAHLSPRFTHCCMNPPYKKIHTGSQARDHARRFGVETVNLYSAFVSAALEMMEPGGQLVAIIPRSFANGPYYKPFRRFILKRAAIRRIHLFDSRQTAFSDDDVLQENVILHLERDGKQSDVIMSVSTDDSFSDLATYEMPFASVVLPEDDEAFIHMPLALADPLVGLGFECSLEDLGLKVSTGPVVDFRLRESLRQQPDETSVPLMYSHHFQGTRTIWPAPSSKKPNAIAVTDESRKWLIPGGVYLVVRRFSAKEEKRRVVASLLDTAALGHFGLVGIENHLNFFHSNKQPMQRGLALGLFVYLNSTVLDEHLRRFSGHTQVNATDLRNIAYPPRSVLEGWGRWADDLRDITQADIDATVEGHR